MNKHLPIENYACGKKKQQAEQTRMVRPKILLYLLKEIPISTTNKIKKWKEESLSETSL